jgi:membrane-bound metal-dependent hydrolase YbcI (DUF457 family)
MPSPVGHVIAGAACGWIVSGAPTGPRWLDRACREGALFGLLGALPDVDLLVGRHSGPTHSLGAAVIVAVAALLALAIAGNRGRGFPGLPLIVFSVACFAAYGSHVLLDWLATDSTPPIGVMALWPVSRQHYASDLHLFMAVSRRYHQGWTFVRQNALAFLLELAILLPTLTLVVWFRPRRARMMR